MTFVCTYRTEESMCVSDPSDSCLRMKFRVSIFVSTVWIVDFDKSQSAEFVVEDGFVGRERERGEQMANG